MATDDEYPVPGVDQTHAELEAHEKGPAGYGMVWVECVLTGDLLSAWALLDDPFRLALAQQWIHANREDADVARFDRDDLAHDLSSPQCVQHPLWPRVHDAVLAELRRDLAGWDAVRLGFLSRPRPVSPGYEVVVLGQGTEVKVIDHSRPMVAYPMLMHLTERGWLIARAGADTAPVPGWPPTFPPGRIITRVDS
ncbi:hypothetical protein ACGFIY_29530 [Micromonospora chersina]|uniref:hypothetical protein n=1 Tax=Micromonospora chersina TaxID=47854 RepID=UPI00371B1147